MNITPNSNRKHIGIYGNTNSGKSSLMNAILGQEISLVSEVEGTTTDPVQKAMERARHSMEKIPLKNGTIYHAVEGRHGASRVMLHPASSNSAKDALLLSPAPLDHQ